MSPQRGASFVAGRPATDAGRLVAELELKKWISSSSMSMENECEVVVRGHDTLARLRPLILFEFCPYALEERGCSASRLLEMLQAHGYSFPDDRGRKVLDTSALVRRTPRFGSINLMPFHDAPKIVLFVRSRSSRGRACRRPERAGPARLRPGSPGNRIRELAAGTNRVS